MTQPDILIHPSARTGRPVGALADDLCHQLDLVRQNKQANVHRIRVDIKKLRAWLRLVRGQSNHYDWKTADRCLRDIARRFSANRDAKIIPATIKKLSRKTTKPEKLAALREIDDHLRSTLSPTSLPEPVEPDRQLITALKRQSFAIDTGRIMERGLKRAYKRAWREGEYAFSKQGSLQDLHRFRKWTKYLGYQIGFVRNACPDYCRREQKQLDRLGKRLGRIHDLDVLRHKTDALIENGDCVAAAKITNKLIDKRTRQLRKTSKRLFKEVFNVSAPEFISSFRQPGA